VQVASPGPAWVLTAAQADTLKPLEGGSALFTVTFGAGYEVAGTYTNCWFDGPVILTPKRDLPQYVNYQFTLYIPQ
jgi:hypothetical protein